MDLQTSQGVSDKATVMTNNAPSADFGEEMHFPESLFV